MIPTKRFMFCLLGVAVLLSGSFGLVMLRASGAAASDDQVECEGVAGRVKAVSSRDWHDTDIDFAQDGYGVPGHFDAKPLVYANVLVREGTCIVAHFSAMAQPMDNSIVFQARVDGVPMQGHLSDWGGGSPWNQVPTRVVADPDFRDELLTAGIPGFDPAQQSVFAATPRMVSHSFFERVAPGWHRVEVYFAGCCSGSGPHPESVAARAGSPTLVVHYG